MTDVDLDALPVVGALDVERTPQGVTFWRTPRWARTQVVDAGQLLGLQMPAGVRLELVTSSSWLELDVAITAVEIEDVFAPTVRFDLVVADEARQSLAGDSASRMLIRPDRTFHIVPGDACTIRFDDLPGDLSVPVEIWLPHNAIVELRGARIAEGATLEGFRSGRPRWLHYGSSISHCFEAPSPTVTWPALVARKAGLDLVNLAVGGQCMLDPHVARTIRDLAPDVVSLKVGANIVAADALRERILVPLLHGFLDTVRERLPETPVVLVTPITCPMLEDQPGPLVAGSDGGNRTVPRAPELCVGSLTLRRLRELVTSVVETRRGDGDQWLHLLDGLELLGPADVHQLHDGLHPDADGYRLIADRFLPRVFGPRGLAPAS